jgi:predicted sulfurtransferase
MHDERTGVRAALQSPERKRCPACRLVKPHTDFTTPGGLSSSCKDCRRVVSRLASRRRQAAMRLLIAAHPEEWSGLLGLVRGHRQLGTYRPKEGGHDEA